MAKLGSYFGLCPLIDHRSLLGVSKDEEKGNVIVTLGKNIAMKYKLSDQKQILSWTTKEKFTAPVIYDKEIPGYVAVFNQMFIRIWSEVDEFLDKLKKYKFMIKIYTILTSKTNEKTFVIFQNGAIEPLNKVLPIRKNFNPPNLLNDKEYISDVLQSSCDGDVYIGLVIYAESQESTHIIWTKFNQLGHQSENYKINLTRDKCSIMGYMFHSDNNHVYLLSLWSDGKLFSYILENSDLQSPGEFYSVIKPISCADNVSLIGLDQNYIAMYGADNNQEGAILVIYNMQFKVSQTKQPFKMFTRGAKLWCMEENLILTVGQNLAVVPYHLENEQLSALIGSHKIMSRDADPDISIVNNVQLGNWGGIKKTKLCKINELIPDDDIKQGCPENSIFEEILPKLMEKHDLKSLHKCINSFYDISENSLVKLLKYILTLDAKAFTKHSKSKLKFYPKLLQPSERMNILCSILTMPFSDVLLAPHLRTGLSLNEVLLLLNFISILLTNEICLQGTNFIETESKLLEWTCVILDCNYQKILFTKDENINKMLIRFNDFVKEELSGLEELEKTVPVLKQLNSRKHICKINHGNYSVEKIKLY